MKRLFCFLLIALTLITLTACDTNDSNSDTDELENTNNTTTEYSNFEPVDLSYENVAKLTDFKCYVSSQEKTITVDGTCAKDLYNLVYNEMSKRDHTPTSSNGNYVYLVFYNSEEEFPTENIKVASFRGTYTIYDDGLLVFSGSPYHSAAFNYKIDSDLYDSVIDMIFGDS